jgi:DNA polymerase-3 subunit alpha
MPGFTHLHVHSEYSLLDGLARVPDLVASAKERGFEALALTDHGAMYGAVQFYRHARRVGLKPIIGCELYVAPRGRGDREHGRDHKAYHLTALARDAVGYRNLVQLVSRAQLEGFYYKPRVDRELLAAHSDGLVVCSGCPTGEVSRLLLEERLDEARATLAWYKEVFGEGYFVELQQHDIDFLPALNRQLVALAAELELPLVATNDVHYARAEDAQAHEVLLCVQTSTTMTDPDRMRLGGTFYLRTEEEMRRLFAELPEAIDNTARVAEMCDLQLEFNQVKLPRFEVPAGESAAGYLRRLCEQGLVERYPELTAEVSHRLDFELEVIGQMGFDDYFLIVWDLCRFARERGVWWNVRGSGAASIVAYALRVTNIDPLRHDLIFERFLNPARVSMPDIDLDFPDDQRDLVIQYTFDRYGHDRVAQIITFGTMGPRAAIRDAGRALDLPRAVVDQVARLVPAIPGKPCTIADALRAPDAAGEPNEFYVPELAERVREDVEVARLVATARSLEGVARHASTHAAGVVIADQPLTAYLPLHRPTRGGDGHGEVLPVTQYNMTDVDSLGLLKVDLLGLSTLTVLRRAAELVERVHGERFTLDNIPLEDPAIFELLASGHVTGVFQVEGAGMRRMLREMRPQRFEHVVAAIALYRPGPMEYIPTYIARLQGREPVTYRHPALEPILAETYGITVYQEQIIRIARDLAGYNAGEADTIRKAVGKKMKDQLLKHRLKFIRGAVANGIPEPTAAAIFDDIETFARYGFNKAHAADYAVIVCQTAYFKARYPVEYLAALLSVERDDIAKIAQVAADCHRLGIKLLAPSVNASELEFSIEALSAADRTEAYVRRRRGIRFGLAAIKNVGEGPVRAILEARAGRPFQDLDDLCRRVDLRAVGKRALESLIRAGALDDFGARAALLAIVDRMVAASGAHHQAAAIGQMSLFGEALPAAETSLLYPLPEVVADPKERLGWEKELIGLFLSEHPLHLVAERLAEAVTTMIGSVDESMDGQPVTLAGMVTHVRVITTKKGDAMAFARLEDLQGEVDVILFPRLYAATKALWEEDNLVLLRGRVEARGDRIQVVAEHAQPYTPETVEEKVEREQVEAQGEPTVGPTYQLFITLPRSDSFEGDKALLKQVYTTLVEYRGSDRFNVRIPNGANTVELEFPNTTTRYCVSLLQALEHLVGEGRVEVAAR